MSHPEAPSPESAVETAVPQHSEQDVPREPARLGPMQRLFGAILSPGETFEDVNRRPTWIAPLLIVTLTGLLATIFMEWRAKPDWDRFFRNQINKAVERSGRTMTPEQIDQQVAMQVKFSKTDLTSPLSIGLLALKMILYVIFTCVVPAGIFALGLMLMQAKTTFKKILSVVAWSTAATGLVGVVVFMAALMVRDQESLREISPTEIASIVPTNLGVLLPSETSPFISSIASSFDIFAIWLLVLFIMGFTAISGARKITRGKVGTLVIGLWLVWVLIKAGAASIFMGMSG